jgi:cupin 2 domain-containing protein
MKLQQPPSVSVRNLFASDGLSISRDTEYTESLIKRGHLSLERIISKGHVTPPGYWYDQDQDEWVVLLKGKASIEFENRHVIHLAEGDYLMLQAGLKHRVAYTSKNPPCIWLALHIKPGL